jgi:hypothetical protein
MTFDPVNQGRWPAEIYESRSGTRVFPRATGFAAPVLRAVLQQPSAAEQIPRPYSRAEENARELNGDFGMTEALRLRTAYMRLSTVLIDGSAMRQHALMEANRAARFALPITKIRA